MRGPGCALDLSRTTGSSFNEAHALAGLGRYVLAAGGTAKADQMLRHALEIFQRIGAADVARKLAALTEAGLPA